MTDLEFEVLDELYFVISFSDLLTATSLEEKRLVETLSSLYDKSWIRVLVDQERDEEPNLVNLNANANKYFYLASKRGLFAHNSN